MKKSLWLLLVVAALIAVFAVAGCMQGTTPEEPTEPEEPTTPPADTACPQVVSTVVTKMYAWTDTSPNFKITITFDENIQSQCADDPANWTITISNPGRVGGTLATTNGDITITGISIDDNQIVVSARVVESGSRTVAAYDTNGDGIADNQNPGTVTYSFAGLICSPDDADEYEDEVNTVDNSESGGTAVGNSAVTIEYADEICWELDTDCVISDELGNGCCGYSGCDCCVEPVCEECEEYCPLGEETCL